MWNITLKMLGKEEAPNLSAKANEAKNLLEFAILLLERHIAKLDPLMGNLLLESGRAALKVNQIISESPRNMTANQRQQLMDAYLKHMSLFERAGGNIIPKHHLLIHCFQRTSVLGNPKFYHTYKDESLNGVIVKIARSSHRLTFYETVHKKFNVLRKLNQCVGMC